VIAFAKLVRGEVTVQDAGSVRARPLAIGARVKPGAVIATGRGTVELQLEVEGEERAQGEGRRVVLGPRSEVACGPGGSAQLALRHGSLYLSAISRPVGIQFGDYQLTLRAGDGEVVTSNSGRARLVAHSGACSVRTLSGEEVADLSSRELLTISAAGFVSRPRRVLVKMPRWLDAHRDLPGGWVQFEERFTGWGAREYEEPLGLLAREKVGGRSLLFLRAVPDPGGEKARRICFGRSVNEEGEGGLFRYRSGSRLRLRFRVRPQDEKKPGSVQGEGGFAEHAPTVRVQVVGAAKHETFELAFGAHRLGVWTEVELELGAFVDRGRVGAESGGAEGVLTPEEAVLALSVLVESSGRALELDVVSVEVYVPGS
jgi:hypothetical protein